MLIFLVDNCIKIVNIKDILYNYISFLRLYLLSSQLEQEQIKHLLGDKWSTP